MAKRRHRMDTRIADIHDFWFGELDDCGLSAPAQHALWFTASETTSAPSSHNTVGAVL